MKLNHFFNLKVIAIVALFLFIGIFPARQAHAVANGTLWGWGMNAFGNLGLGWASYGYDNVLGFSRDFVLSPTQVETATNWVSLSAGNYFVMAVKADGTLWGWGANYLGNLGLGDTVNRLSPTQVGTATNWRSVSSGDNFVLAIKTDGTLWAWGDNGVGQLGLGDTTNRWSPTQVGTGTNWASVSAGYSNTAAIKTDGTLWVWGDNVFGELGQGDTISRYYPTQVGIATNWASVSAMGQFTTIAIKTDGTLWSAGWNQWGQLGLGDTTAGPGTGRNWSLNQVPGTNWLNASLGDTYTMAMKNDGTLWVWGRVSIPFAVNCDVTGCYGETTSPTQVGVDTNWRSFAAYPYPTGVAAIKTDGTLWAWGSNWSGNLGLGDTISRNSPVQVGTGTNWGNVTVGIYGTMANTILPVSCAASTVSNCNLPLTTSGSSAGGSCGSGYAGSCNYLCTNGVWSLNSNSCTLSPTATLDALPSTIDSGQSSVLAWNSTNATSCTASGGFSTGGATSGSASTGALTSPQNYQVLCTGPGGSVNSNTAAVTVQVPTVTLGANPKRLQAGTNTQIAWSASQVRSCTVLGPGLSSTNLSGSQAVTIASQSTYVILCQTNGLPITKAVIVNVVPKFSEF